MENVDSRVRIGVLACLGGLATGFASCALISSLRKRRSDHAVTANRKFGELLFNDDGGFGNKEIADFSDITALVGSVSDSQVCKI